MISTSLGRVDGKIGEWVGGRSVVMVVVMAMVMMKALVMALALVMAMVISRDMTK